MNFKFFCIILISFLCIIQCEKDLTGVSPFPFTWEKSTPDQQGFSTKILDSAFIQAENEEFVDGLLVIRNGYIVAEKYFNGYETNTPHNVMSVSKSFLSAMTGVAFHDGFIDSLGEKALDYFPEYIYTGIDPKYYHRTFINDAHGNSQ